MRLNITPTKNNQTCVYMLTTALLINCPDLELAAVLQQGSRHTHWREFTELTATRKWKAASHWFSQQPESTLNSFYTMVEDGLTGLGLLCQFRLYDILGKPQRWGDLWVSEATVEGWLHRATRGDFFYMMEMPYRTVAVIVWLYTGVKANTTMYRPQSNL